MKVNMKIGVTGGSGFIGQYIVETLENNSNTELLKIIDLEKPSFSGTFEFIHGDIRDDQMIDTFCRDIDFVIHLAAAHHDYGISEEEFFDVNESGTEKLLKAMTKHQIKNIIFYSSVAVYGTVSQPVDENTPPNPESPYGASKLAAEKKILDWIKHDKDRKAFIIRPTVVIGARNYANMYFLIDQISKNRYLFHFGNGTNIKSIACVRNLVKYYTSISLYSKIL